jgi:hypothetical protein
MGTSAARTNIIKLGSREFMLNVAKKQHTWIDDSQSQRSRESPFAISQRCCFVGKQEVPRLLARFWPNRYVKDVGFTPHRS